MKIALLCADTRQQTTPIPAIKFFSDLRQVDGFLRVFRFPNKTDRHNINEILLKVALNTTTLTPCYQQDIYCTYRLQYVCRRRSLYTLVLFTFQSVFEFEVY
jgi:hypothetical protein